MNLDLANVRGTGRTERRGGGGVIVASTIAMLEQKQYRATPSAMAKSDVKIGGVRTRFDNDLHRRDDLLSTTKLRTTDNVAFYLPPVKNATSENKVFESVPNTVQKTVPNSDTYFKSHRRTPSVYSMNFFKSVSDDSVTQFKPNPVPTISSDRALSDSINNQKQHDEKFSDMASSSTRPLSTQQSSSDAGTSTIENNEFVSESFGVVIRKSPVKESNEMEDTKCDSVSASNTLNVSTMLNRDSSSTNSLEIGSTSSDSTKSLSRLTEENKDDNFHTHHYKQESLENQATNLYMKNNPDVTTYSSSKDEPFSQNLTPINIKTNPSYILHSRTDRQNKSIEPNTKSSVSTTASIQMSQLNDCSFKIPEAFQNIDSEGSHNDSNNYASGQKTVASLYDIPMDSSVDSKYSESGNERKSTTDHGDGSSSNWLTSDNDDSSVTTSDSCTSDEEDETSSSGQEFILENEDIHHGGGLEPITEEDRPVTASSVNTGEEDNSTRCDDDFQWFGNNSRLDHCSQHSSANSYTKENKQILIHPSTSPVRLDPQQHIRQSPIHHQNITAKPPTSRPPLRVRSENSPRRHTPEKQTGSLDRRRIHHGNRQERDQKSRSTQDHRSPDDHREMYFPPPPPKSDLVLSPQSTQTPCSCYDISCTRRSDELSQEGTARYEKSWLDESVVHKKCEIPLQNDQKFIARGESPFRRHHERTDPKRYGSSTVLIDYDTHDRHYYRPRNDFNHHIAGSHPDLYGINSDRSHSGCRNMLRERSVDSCSGCCAYHTLPRLPCCHYGSEPRNYNSWTPYNKNPDQDGKVYRLESEKESLQLQVSVLTEQIEAQTDKISELEKMLAEKKQLLGNTEESLQREMLSRSSLETQKLELMSAMSELKLQQAALERENIELRTSHYNNNSLGNHIQQPNIRKPLLSRTSPVPQHTSTPVHSSQLTGNITSPSSNCIVSSTTLGGASPIRTDGAQTNHEILQPRTPPASFRRTVDIRYGSLPRQAFPTNGRIDSNANQQQQSATLGPKKGVVFADADKTIEDNIDSTSYSPQQSPLLQINKNKGIKKIFSKMKRSGSGNLEDLPGEGEFRRGGVRATAGARLGWSETQDVIRPEKPFDEWDTNNIVDWLQDLGLDMYIIEVKRWIKNGAQLRLAPVHDLEKELGIKNALHRKKIQLAILEFTDENASDSLLSAAGKLDTSWVLRWLDDTGLPQHKDAFSLGRVDGRMLHRLTIDDLAALHVTSLLHANSLRRGIQVLREHSFDPDCLIRRSTPGESDKLEPEKVKLWTAHRVMEWLREVDLAEYAPNLRGAGVHGSLMVYEPKFTAELLATLLNISPSKTLLRRHLSTHFKELLGREVIQEKREAEAILGYVPLTPAAKLKIAKKSQFSLKRKKSKGEPDYGDLVCPLGSSSGAANTIIQSGELTKANIGSTSHGDASGMMKTADGRVVGVCHLIDDPALTDEVFHSVGGGTSPTPTRIKDSMLV